MEGQQVAQSSPATEVAQASAGTQEELLRQIVALQKQVLEKKPEKQKGNGGRVFYVVVMVLAGLMYMSIFFFGGLLGMTSSRVSDVGLGFLHNVALAPMVAILAIWSVVTLVMKRYDAKILVNVAFGAAFLYEIVANIDGFMRMTSARYYSYLSSNSAQAAILSLGRFVLGAVVIGVLLLVFNKAKIAGEKPAALNGVR